MPDRCTVWANHLQILPGAWIMVDMTHHTIIDGSAHFSKMVGRDSAHLKGAPIASLAARPQGDQWSKKTFDADLLDMPGRHEDVLLRTASDDTLTSDVHVSHPIDKNGQNTVICLITDGTERQHLQSELIGKHQQLRKAYVDLERQSQDLVRLNREIREMSAMLTRATSFSAIGEITAELTHQLNNPLAAAVGAARRINLLIQSDKTEGLDDMLALLKESLSRLGATMNELKRAYRTSRASDTALEHIDLKSQVDSALMLMQQQLQNLDVIIEIPSDLPLIYGRPAQIQHLIVNLIDNAALSMGPSGTIHLLAEQRGERVMLLVGDSGPGIPPEQREKVFEPFFTTRESGTGLGLAVVRRNVENNKATIKVRASRYGGAEFEIGFEIAPC